MDLAITGPCHLKVKLKSHTLLLEFTTPNLNYAYPQLFLFLISRKLANTVTSAHVSWHFIHHL